ncbi:hypothetical protein [Saccharicrinis aurantiacus]|uniref:hypothetical protein n=1 Tax=Saccharicrinis aurantiacus TaxID=1849719 RepID=UPI000837D55D|nr:hypothetical protein [Saccharicrinis aurantiacus]
MYKLITTILFLTFSYILIAQPVPAIDENIPYLVTFGKDGETAWGDNDFTQVIFYSVPKSHTEPIYIRVYDPDIGGKIDEQKGKWNTKMKYSIYGGKGTCSDDDARKINKSGNYKSGTLLYTKTFGISDKYDEDWYTFGPINPTEGEYLPDYGGYVFKVIVEGISGDDGNLYSLYQSSKPKENVPVEGAFAFYFKYKIRLHDNVNEVSHIYPYIDDKVLAIKQSNFDWDNDGIIRIISVAKNGEMLAVSADDNWAESRHTIHPSEKNTSYDIQIIKNKTANIKNNNVVIYLENQFGELMPFYSVPIGGIPKYKYSIGIKPKISK